MDQLIVELYSVEGISSSNILNCLTFESGFFLLVGLCTHGAIQIFPIFLIRTRYSLSHLNEVVNQDRLLLCLNETWLKGFNRVYFEI